jgi:hypothetical protein
VAFNPEVLRPGDPGYDAAETDEFLQRWTWLLENSIPLGGGMRIGLDPIISLIPGAGDVVSGLLSTVLITRAYQAGIPKATLLRMVANVGIDTVVGSIPLFGDLFDFAWKANTKNLQLYRQAMTGRRDEKKDVGFLIILLFVVVVLIAVPVVLAAYIISALV